MWMGLLGVAGVAFVSGPGFRWGGTWALGKVLQSKGLSGDFVLGGNLFTGITLEQTNLTGVGDETQISIETAKVAYAPWKFLTGGVPAVPTEMTLLDSQITIDLRNRPSSEEDEESPSESSGNKRFPWDRLPQPRLSLKNVNVTVLLPEDQAVILENLDLSVARHETGSLSWQRIALPNDRVMEASEGTLAYTETGLALSKLTLFPQLACEKLEVAVENRRLVVASLLDIYESRLQIDATMEDRAQIRMSEGALNMAALREAWFEQVPLHGRVEALEVNVRGMHEPWHQWQADVDLTTGKLAFRDFVTDSIALQVNQSSSQRQARLQLTLAPNNTLELKATSPNDSGKPNWDLITHQLTLDSQLNELAPWLDQSGLHVEATNLTGNLSGTLRGRELTTLDGTLNLGSGKAGNWVWPAVRLTAREAEEGAGHPLALRVTSDQELIDGDIYFTPAIDQYKGELVIHSRNLEKLQIPGLPDPFQGAVNFTWSGQGDVKAKEHRGRLEFTGNNVRPISQDIVYETEGIIGYEGNAVQIQTMETRWGDLRLQWEGKIDQSGVDIPQLSLSHAQGEWLGGHIRIPFAAEAAGADKFWMADREVDISIHSLEIPVRTIAGVAGQEDNTLQGTCKLDIDVKGLPRELHGRLDFVGRQLGILSEGKIPTTGDVDVSVRVEEGRLEARANVKHTNLERVEVEAKVPFQPREAAALSNAPVSGRLRIPSTDLGFLTEYVEPLRTMQGELAADVTLSGTVDQPLIDGELQLIASDIRFDSLDLPRLTDTKVVIQGTPERIVFKDVRTRFQGGQVIIEGGVDIQDLAKPNIDVALKARQALLTRNEQMIVRANGDLRLVGPLEKARLSGKIGLVESRYFQEIELIPTNKPVASLPSSPTTIEKTYGTDALPIRDWDIDVAIVTEEPFRVRTNFASADITTNLRLLGKGDRVFPVGDITLRDAFADLPFSRLDLKDSAIDFTEGSGFPGILSIRGETRIRDYRVRAIVSGNMNNVDYLLTSSPPMPEEEIMALLGTGVTREELVGSSEAAASRAALLLFDKLWRKIAKKDWEDPKSMREKRLTFESGQVNPRTGRSLTTARLRLTDHFSLTGDADIDGDFRGLLHYLFRF